MSFRTMSLVLLMTAIVGFVPAAAQANDQGVLRNYVQQNDGSYAVEIINQTAIGMTTVYTVKLTSQTWQGRDWTHWLSIIVPQALKHESQAILVVAGGRNNTDPPDLNRPEARLIANMAAGIGAPTAVVQQIPNQPLFEGRREDDLIAYTFNRYLEGDSEHWPALLPMVKGVVRAMDGVGEVLREQRGVEIERFVVAGGSKRGWTTYLTAAVDPRVKAMAPMVFDVLDMEAQIEHQQNSYGNVSRMIQEYADHGVIERIGTARGRSLQRIVDPFAYRKRLTIPKLIVLGTNDPYWVADSASLYIDALPGPTYLHYVPNGGHSLGHEAVPTALAFLHAALNDEPLPELHWRRGENGALEVQWEGDGRAKLYEARSADRDFRQTRWSATELDGDGTVHVHPEPPEEQWLAFFVQVQFPGPGDSLAPYTLSTPITVLPDDLPHGR